MKKILVILAEGFETIEALAPVDIWRRAGAAVTLAGLGGEKITSAQEVTVSADCAVAAIKNGGEFDLLFLPGGMPGSLNLNCPAVKKLAKEAAAAGKYVAAICAAPAKALQPFGLLKEKRATCYPGCETAFDDSVEFSEDLVVVSDNIITSRGAGTAMLLAYEATALLFGRAKAEELRQGMLYINNDH